MDIWVLSPSDYVAKQYFVRLRHYDGKGEWDSLRVILAIDADDAISQVESYALAEDLYWHDVSIPTPTEPKQMRAQFDAQWEEHRRKKNKDGPAEMPKC